MEGDEGLRTVECLRGRLLAERASSKAANLESEQITKKVIELEKQLKMEIKSRNRAEKRLNFLMKKLDSLNISYVSADEFSEKSEISSVSSSKSQPQIESQKTRLSDISTCVTDTDNLEYLDEMLIYKNSNENVIESSKKDGDKCDLQKENNSGLKFFVTQYGNNEEHDQDTYKNVDKSMASIFVEEKLISKVMDDQEHDATCDNSLSLVVVDSMFKKETKGHVSLSNGNVKDVLDDLRYAKEYLQTSMDMRRHMKSSIAQPRLDRISC